MSALGHVVSAGCADQCLPVLNKHHHGPQSPVMSATCIKHREGNSFPVLQRKRQKFRRQWESNTALNRLNNPCFHEQRTQAKSCPSDQFKVPWDNNATIIGLLSIGPPSPTWLKITHLGPASSRQMHVIRDGAAGGGGQDQRLCTSKSITAGKGNSKPLPYVEGHHLQRNNNSSTIGLKGQAALYRTSERRKYSHHLLFYPWGSFPLLESGNPINYT